MRNAKVAMASEARFRLHLRRMRPKLDRLRARGCSDPTVLAILTVEGLYRPAVRRLIEYVAWAGLSLLGSSAVERITVGIAQVRISHWIELGLLDSERFSVRRLALVLDPVANYDACQLYLAERRMLGESDTEELTQAYTGAPRRDYAEMLDRALLEVTY
jgi:hypothetical protein